MAASAGFKLSLRSECLPTESGFSASIRFCEKRDRRSESFWKLSAIAIIQYFPISVNL